MMNALSRTHRHQTSPFQGTHSGSKKNQGRANGNNKKPLSPTISRTRNTATASKIKNAEACVAFLNLNISHLMLQACVPSPQHSLACALAPLAHMANRSIAILFIPYPWINYGPPNIHPIVVAIPTTEKNNMGSNSRISVKLCFITVPVQQMK